MDWALEFAPPMPAQLVSTLAGLARHADKHGRGAYPSVGRLAAYACKDPRTVRRDLKKLRELGLIRLGDQSKTLHLPRDRRPEVYDLAVERTVPGGREGRDEGTQESARTLASSRRRGGKQKPKSDAMRGDAHVRPDADVTPDSDENTDESTGSAAQGAYGVTPTSPADVHVIPGRPRPRRGDVGVRSGVTPTSPKPELEPVEEPLSGPTRLIRAASVVATHEEREFLAWVTDTHKPRGTGWWKTVTANGDLPTLAADWRATQAPRTPATTPLPPWCGHCGDGIPLARTNADLRKVEDARGIRRPCPNCHPTAHRKAS
jgi:DNA-binding transcriptional ArsR family regulator